MSEEQTVSVMLAVNDERGAFTGQCDEIDVADVIRLEGSPLHVNAYQFQQRQINVGDVQLEGNDYHSWVGNWCWDQISISASLLVTLLEYLRTQEWTVLEGQSDLFEAYQQGKPLAEYIERALS